MSTRKTPFLRTFQHNKLGWRQLLRLNVGLVAQGVEGNWPDTWAMTHLRGLSNSDVVVIVVLSLVIWRPAIPNSEDETDLNDR
jgi:hypothetical protein